MVTWGRSGDTRRMRAKGASRRTPGCYLVRYLRLVALAAILASCLSLTLASPAQAQTFDDATVPQPCADTVFGETNHQPGSWCLNWFGHDFGATLTSGTYEVHLNRDVDSTVNVSIPYNGVAHDYPGFPPVDQGNGSYVRDVATNARWRYFDIGTHPGMVMERKACAAGSSSCQFVFPASGYPDLAPGAPPPPTVWFWGSYDVRFLSGGSFFNIGGGEFAIRVVFDQGGSSGQPPTAAFTATPSGAPGAFHFVSDSTDPDHDITTQHWDFGDSGTADGSTADHTFTTHGPHAVTLTVGDGGGHTNFTSKEVDGALKISQVVTSPVDLIAADPATLSVKVRNESTFPATNVAPSLSDITPAGGLGTITGPVPATQSIAPGDVATFDYQISPPNAGAVSLHVAAAGTAGGSVTAEQVTRQLDVNGAQLTGELTFDPESPSSSKHFKTTLTVTNNGTSVLDNVVPGTLAFTPSTGMHVGAPTPASASSLQPHASTAFDFDVVADSAGDYDATVHPHATDHDTNDDVAADVEKQLTVVSGVLVVNVTGDDREAEADRGDEKCDVDATTDGPQCTLRAAIEESNALQAGGDGAQSITFNIPGGGQPEISPATALPDVEGTVDIDGTTQPGAVKPLLHSDAQPLFEGLVFTGSGSTLRGLDIRGFSVGVVLRGAGGHHVVGNHLRYMRDVGVQIESGGNEIGSGVATNACTGDCNELLDSGNGRDLGDTPTAAERDAQLADPRWGNVVVLSGSGNQIAGNLIDDQQDFGARSFDDGVVVRGGDGTVVGPGNVISGRVGVLAAAPATIKGNLIGLHPDGTPVIESPLSEDSGLVGRGWVGVWARAPGVVVGGPAPQDTNVISAWGIPSLGEWVNLGNRVRAGGVLIDGVGVVVRGNLIGTNTAGTGAMPNFIGLRTGAGSVGAQIDDNVIAGNTHDGVANLHDAAARIAGNRIGTNRDGTAAVPNEVGVRSVGVVGGPRAESTCVSPCNLISGNHDEGVNAAKVQGNFIGTTLDGTGPLPNGTGVSASGVLTEIGGPSRATVDGTCDQWCNLIAFNHNAGIGFGSLYPGGVGAANIHGNVVRGNSVAGIDVQSDGPTTIGGSGEGEGNLIDHNHGPGVQVGDVNGVTSVKVDRNTITGNDGPGVFVVGGPSTFGIDIGANSVFDNGGLGIDLSNTGSSLFPNPDGPNQNVRFGVDGPNHLAPWPHLATATLSAGNLRVTGAMDFFRLTVAVRVDVFASRACDPTTFGEGEQYLGSVQAAALTGGRINATLPAPPSGFGFITGTATSVDGSTSEFSPCRALQTSTVLRRQANAGDSELDVASNDGFEVGDHIVIGPETDHEEHATVTGFGSLIIDQPVQFDHAAGELVVLEERPSSSDPTAALARTGTGVVDPILLAFALILIGSLLLRLRPSVAPAFAASRSARSRRDRGPADGACRPSAHTTASPPARRGIP
jgi:hypothetical protein